MSGLSSVSMWPPQVRMSHQRAELRQHTTDTELTVSRERGGLRIENEPLQLDLDNRAFFDSLGLKSISGLAQDLIARSRQAALAGTGRYGVEGDILAGGGPAAIAEVARMRTATNIETMLGFIPESPPVSHWTGGGVTIDYTPDRLRFSWQIGAVDFQYRPYRLRFQVMS